MSDDQPHETRKPRSFAGFLKNQRRGELERELSEAIAGPARGHHSPGGESIFYAEDDGTLTRDDPRQRRLPGVARTEDEAAEAVDQLKESLADAGVTAVTVSTGGVSTTVNPSTGEVVEKPTADGPDLRAVPDARTA